jgi:hypothetical protein
MGGRETTRGILLQTIVCLLEALQDNVWESLALEPDVNAEKVDIVWHYPDSRKATQVKSSQNQLNVPHAKQWACELENSYEGATYELILMGPCSKELSKGQRYGNVEIPCPKPLDIQGLIEQSAHRLAVYLEYRGKPAGRATTRENVIDSLIGRLQRYSTNGTGICRDDFQTVLDQWVQDALGNEEQPSLEQLRILEKKISKLIEDVPYILTLQIDDSEAVRWRGTTQRYMRELDQVLPGDDFETQRSQIAWHKPTEQATQEDYQRGCGITKGLLQTALDKLQEQLEPNPSIR